MKRGPLTFLFVALFLVGSADWAALNLLLGPAAFARPPATPGDLPPAPPGPPSLAPSPSPAQGPASSSSLDPTPSAAPLASTSAAAAPRTGPWADFRFATGSTTLGQDALPVLQSLAKRMRQEPKLRPTFEGHADDPGNKAVNEFLALQRARLARAFIASQGVDPGRIDVAGFGNARKLDDSGTPEAAARNRRVEVLLK